VFSSGHDLKEIQNSTTQQRQFIFDTCADVMLSLRNLNIPVIAQVNGLATAAGCQLVATCDLAVCSEEAQFATPGVKIGLFCTTPGVALGRAVKNTKKAMEMLLTGKPMSAKEALENGLVNKVVAGEVLKEVTLELAESVARASGDVLKIGKGAFYRQMKEDIVTAYEFAGKVMVENLEHVDAREGISAFLEKREPKWQS